jgi:hypothetical protein
MTPNQSEEFAPLVLTRRASEWPPGVAPTLFTEREDAVELEHLEEMDDVEVARLLLRLTRRRVADTPEADRVEDVLLALRESVSDSSWAMIERLLDDVLAPQFENALAASARVLLAAWRESLDGTDRDGGRR